MKTPRIIVALFALSVLLPFGLLAGISAERWTLMKVTAENDTLNTVTIIEQQARHIFETQELVLKLVDGMVRNMSDEEVRSSSVAAQLAELASQLPQTVSIWVSNSEGAIIAASLPWPSSLSLAGLEYFEVHRHGFVPHFISEPYIGRTTNLPSFAMSQRRSAPGGAFVGILHVAISPLHFENAFGAMKRGLGGAASLIREDGVILARHPPAPAIERLEPSSPLMRALATGSARGELYASSSVDGVERVYAYRRLGAFPAFIGYGVDMPVRVAAWRADLLRDALLALAATLLLASATWLAHRAFRERSNALHALEQETDRRIALEARLAQAHALEALGRMARGVAHDFNNLLTVVIGNLEMLEESATSPVQRGVAHRARKAAEAGAQLAGSLLVYARTQVLQVQPVAIGSLLEEMKPVLEDLAGQKTKVTLDIAPGLPDCLCDPAQLRAAIGNLVANAREAMPETGGRIALAVREVTLTAGDLADSDIAPGRFVAISVTDNGRGMSSEIVARAFEPFFTTKTGRPASGLGLSHVGGLVGQLGGRVRLSSEPGTGTTVTLELPAMAATTRLPPASDEPASSLPAADVTTPRRVLVVDDQPEIRALAERILIRAGYDVAVAACGAEAASRVEAGERVDVLLTDVVMPGEVNGLALLERVRCINPAVAGLLMSGYTPDTLTLNAAGAVFLPKPFTRQALLDAVKTAIG
ncbi:hybrid sensor histidine kinase/response regulator [Falsiroseomonas tokyonensis]|uniref:histidine kinase n=1 Tax=Falsiroseomonas tokyonensis TaxID=430521 RepID=A0ABV7BRA1_9PROT|nr:hybrid sensor histidine kinase/response regulator [Falsiroseomonas tokyonensis]MBU8537344.1 response regulator [Falsiroseomonas tokyonensis]